MTTMRSDKARITLPANQGTTSYDAHGGVLATTATQTSWATSATSRTRPPSRWTWAGGPSPPSGRLDDGPDVVEGRAAHRCVGVDGPSTVGPCRCEAGSSAAEVKPRPYKRTGGRGGCDSVVPGLVATRFSRQAT